MPAARAPTPTLQELPTERTDLLEDVGLRETGHQQCRESHQRDQSLHGVSSLPLAISG
jgi:hypothetical protein